MKRYIVLLFFVIAMAILGKSVLFSEEIPITPTVPCPCEKFYPGYYFSERYYPNKPVLFTNMPMDQLIGYIIMDSIISYGHREYPSAKAQDDFIESLTCSGDTLNYAMKYLYRLADYNPFLYYNFLTSSQKGKTQPMSVLPHLLKHIGSKCGNPKQYVIKAEYILHLQTNEVEPFTYLSAPGDYTHLDYVYCQVIDNIKGQVLPDFSTAIEVIREDTTKIFGNLSTSLVLPPNTNFLFYYNTGWSVTNGTKTSQIKVEENKEYIVFAFITRACINENVISVIPFRTEITGDYQYYDIRPTAIGASGGVFPVVNGIVIDKHNDFGWGTEVPISTFKQNLQTLIDSIKNYDE